MKVAIVGAGVMGRLAALKLIGAQHRVTLFEAQSFDHPQGAAAISAGMISPLSEAVHAPPEVVRLGLQSHSLWPDALSQLRELDPEHHPVFFQQHGTVAISFSEEQDCLLCLYAKMHQLLPEHHSQIRMLYNQEVLNLEPDLERFETAVFLKNEGQICNRQFLAASTRAIRQHAQVIEHWPLEGNGSELQNQYDWVIDCRGAGAVKASTYAETGAQALHSVRGEAIRVRTKRVHFTRPVRIIQQRFHVYVVPKPDNIFVVGTTDLGDRGTRSVTVRSSLDLLSAIYCLHPGFADAEILEVMGTHRAFYSDNQPKITQNGNIICANGLSRQGWLLGPALVEDIFKRVTC
ncbi:MAG: FAD-dependent oxidoreductase [Reinekea forsetii]|nr:FAD-dependent oxidoreductase [Reinekea forsetii]MDO7674544.1 FAD-dependent oxidoreductase [Reinekea forsetii]